MDFEPFKIVFGILWMIYSIIRLPHRLRYRKENFAQSPYLLIEIFFGLLFLAGITVIPVLWVFTDLFIDYDLSFHLYIRIAGVILAFASLFLFYWVHRTLKENWSPSLQIRDGHELITTGPYQYIRHPMYTQIWIWCIAQVLITSNWIVRFSALATWTILFFLRIKREEKMMIAAFGEEYEKYIERTGAIVPKFNDKLN